jgi:glycosyltransferase involved in cell wall biosynthesis
MNRLVHKCCFVPLFLFVCICARASDQDISELYTLYQNREMEQLELRLATLPKEMDQVPDVVFFRTIFSENGEEAVAVYEKIYGEADGWLKKETAGKLSQYYYALGYYVKAEEYATIARETPARLPETKTKTEIPEAAPRPEEPRYAIQVGAFSYRDNAQKMLEILNQQRLDASIVERQINGKPLYCVWITGKNDPDATHDYAEELKRKYNIPYRIVQTQ